MKIIKKFDQWITEDFAQVGVAPEGNVVGMGNPVPPTSTSTGSGDQWPSLGTKKKKSKLVCPKCGKIKKRCKC